MGSGGAGGGDAKRVVVKKIELHSDDLKQPLIMDLTLAPEKIKEQTFKVKEGAEYQLHFFFQVNNEILSGLRYSQVNRQSFSYENELTFKVVKRKGVPVDKNNIMVGSYAPKAEDHSFKTGSSFEFHTTTGKTHPTLPTLILISNFRGGDSSIWYACERTL